jgi:general secretion pathway protein A
VYQAFYGLRELPFDLTPNPRYLFFTAKHREALSNLQYGISGRRGVTLLLGEAGMGKTTLVRAVVEAAPSQSTRCVYLNNPTLTRDEFVEFLAHAFELSDRASSSKTALLTELEQVLRDSRAQGITTALLVDEAQAAPLELLEEVRLLANIETATEKLLPVVLAGQPQLGQKLNDPALRQLKQRIALRCHLQPLDLKETAAYIAGRVSIAGGDSTRLFTKEAVELIHLCSHGIPRTISVICDNALVNGFAADRPLVTWDIVYEVCRDFDLDPPSAPVARSAPPGAPAASYPPARAAAPVAAPSAVAVPSAAAAPGAVAPTSVLTAPPVAAAPPASGLASAVAPPSPAAAAPQAKGAAAAPPSAAVGRPAPAQADRRAEGLFSMFCRPRRFSFF